MFQQVSFVFGAILFFASMPVFSVLFGNEMAFENLSSPQYLGIAGGFVIVLLFTFWVFKKYKPIVSKAESVLRELED